MGVSINGGTPEAAWFTTENPNLKWMILGYPDFRKPPDTESTTIDIVVVICGLILVG